MRVESCVAGDRTIAVSFFRERDEIRKIPVAGEVAVVNNQWLRCIKLVERLLSGVTRAFFVGIDTDDFYVSAERIEFVCHSKRLVVQVIVVADECDLIVTWEHVVHVADDSTTFDLYHRFRNGVSRLYKPLTGS